MDTPKEKPDDARIEDTERAIKTRCVSVSENNGLGMHEMAVLTPEEIKAEKRYVLKLDLIVLPLIAVMYFLATLDRGDISNAAIAGMDAELHINPKKLSQCVAFFFIGYIVCQIPGNILMRAIGPNVQLGGAMIGWGLATTVMCEAKNWQAIAGLRVLIGAIEAFLQAGPLYLTLWYRREELATRGAIFFSMMAVAGSMNGLIAYGVEHNLNGVHGWGAWRWIFLIEGIMSVGMGFVVLALLPATPETAGWVFTKKEKEIGMRRSREAFNIPHTKIQPKQLIAVIKDPKVWFYAFVYSCTNISGACFSSFLPIIIRLLGYSTLKTQLLTIPVYVVTGVFTIIVCTCSDRFRKRGIFLIGSFLLAAVGWLLLIVSSSRNLSFGGTFLVGMGSYPSVVLIQSWMNSNVIGFTKRAGSLAFIMIFGQSFALLGAEIFNDAPKYYRGKGLSLGSLVVGALATILLMFYLRYANDRKRRNQDSEEASKKRALGMEEICDDHPDFMFWY
ncbi:putative pantothenate transporter [Lipomyces tetrasporus]|uniref:Pantothenate transporter n=1 Tax=Lipomyces tetrasporus TaxID=54092 RepID=A0AAD7VWN3_9ASCO|nr:putative pantothenate transporter [Lipomyces tetrasporus]KAJ8103705.1 putative pantothenate transporter [Lipomyces tetrasporus]